MKNFILFIITGVLFLFTSCYTYNIPSGATTPLITEQGEKKASVGANFNEAGGNFTIALTNHALFSASGNFIFSKNYYKPDYDSLFDKKTPNNFEVAFGYYDGMKKFANNILFGIGTGNNVYNFGRLWNNYLSGYFQTEYIQYFLQYNAGFKYQKIRRGHKRFKEQGLSLRYAYHNYHLIGISEEYKYEEIWNEEAGYYDYRDYIVTSKVEKNSFFNSFSVYYFFRTGNDKIQFEVSPGFTFYDRVPNFNKYRELTTNLHFNVGLVFNIGNLL
ncbi:MAG: hypothetical protein GXO80_12860 [Chlorobi bacterium]|nr:hypothetical protein [Chlorobiota bacterium]